MGRGNGVLRPWRLYPPTWPQASESEALGGWAGGGAGLWEGISKSEVRRICQALDVQVQAFLSRPLEFSRYPYVYLDATYLYGRDPARQQVISRAVVVAVVITANNQP